MRYLYKRRFLEAYDLLSDKEREAVRDSEKQIRRYHRTRDIPLGLGLKKLYGRQGEAVYEARVGLALRILWAETQDLAVFLLLGSHDEVRRYLKKL